MLWGQFIDYGRDFFTVGKANRSYQDQPVSWYRTDNSSRCRESSSSLSWFGSFSFCLLLFSCKNYVFHQDDVACRAGFLFLQLNAFSSSRLLLRAYCVSLHCVLDTGQVLEGSLFQHRASLTVSLLPSGICSFPVGLSLFTLITLFTCTSLFIPVTSLIISYSSY